MISPSFYSFLFHVLFYNESFRKFILFIHPVFVIIRTAYCAYRCGIPKHAIVLMHFFCVVIPAFTFKFYDHDIMPFFCADTAVTIPAHGEKNITLSKLHTLFRALPRLIQTLTHIHGFHPSRVRGQYIHIRRYTPPNPCRIHQGYCVRFHYQWYDFSPLLLIVFLIKK